MEFRFLDQSYGTAPMQLKEMILFHAMDIPLSQECGTIIIHHAGAMLLLITARLLVMPLTASLFMVPSLGIKNLLTSFWTNATDVSFLTELMLTMFEICFR